MGCGQAGPSAPAAPAALVTMQSMRRLIGDEVADVQNWPCGQRDQFQNFLEFRERVGTVAAADVSRMPRRSCFGVIDGLIEQHRDVVIEDGAYHGTAGGLGLG